MSETPKTEWPDMARGYAFLLRHLYAPYQHVETQGSADDLARLYARIEAAWRAFGETEPHWSVITDEAFRAASLDQQMENFLVMGRENVDRVAAAFDRQGLRFEDVGSVIDFGCGVGRVSAAFSARGCAVTGVDISAAHLAEAEAHFDKAGLTGATFRRLATPTDIDTLPQVDLVYSLIVLQHNPPPLIARLLRHLLGRVRPGGLTYFQLPTYKTGYSYDIAGDLGSPGGEMEMHVLPQHEVYQILREEGFSLLEVSEDASCWDPVYRSQVFLAQKAPRLTLPEPAPPPKSKGLLSRLNARRKAARAKSKPG